MDAVQKKKELFKKDFWNEKTEKFEKLHQFAFSKEAIRSAYKMASKAKGAITVGGDDNTLDGMTVDRLDNLSEALINGSWKAGKAKRVMISKKDSKKFRPLTILSGDDKIVSQAVKNVLEPIYEGNTEVDKVNKISFSPTSHGFRHGRGAHSALECTITWGLVSWFSKIDIKKYYDSINQNRLINIIEEKVNDQIITDTIRKLFNMEVVNLQAGGPDTSKGWGIPQGNPLSPLLANIYLDKLDKFMEGLAVVNNKGERLKTTRKWNKAIWVSAKELGKTKGSKRNNLKRQLYREKVKEAHKKNISKYGTNDQEQEHNKFHRVYYVRYADDFLIGIRGPKELAKKVVVDATQFLKANLQLEVDNTNIYDARNNKVEFLGFEIKTPGRKERAVMENRKVIAFKKLRSRITNRVIQMDARKEKMLAKLVDQARNVIFKNLLKQNLTKEQLKAEAEKIAVKEVHQGLEKNLDPAVKWTSKELRKLTESEIAVHELRQLGLDHLLEKQMQLKKDMLQAVGGQALAKLKIDEVEAARKEGKPQHTQDRILFGQAQGLSPRLYIPMKKITERIRGWGMLQAGVNKPKANGIVLKYHDAAIIDFYKAKAKGLLEYYKPGNNFHELKKALDYHMRYSLLHTLAAKHKKKVHEIKSSYGTTPALYIAGKDSKEPKVLAKYLTPAEINNTRKGYNLSLDPKILYYDELTRPITKLSLPKALFNACSVKGCTNTDIEIHHVRKLMRKVSGFIIQSVKSKTQRTKTPLQTVESSLTRKQIPLCKEHHQALHNGKIGREMLDDKILYQKATILGGNNPPIGN